MSRVPTRIWVAIGVLLATTILLVIPYVARVDGYGWPWSVSDSKIGHEAAWEQPQIAVEQRIKRVAIVGAGASGTSAAFWLSRAAQEVGLDSGELQMDIFERESYVGGRSTIVYPYDDLTLPPIELGASVFVDANRILMRAVDHFDLSLDRWETADDADDTDGEFGVWDGQSFLVTTKGGVGVWDKAKLLWRYGYFGPKRTLDAVGKAVDQLMQLYDSAFMRATGPWASVDELNERLRFEKLTGKSARDYVLDDVKGGEKFADEVIEASTRVNYAQDVDKIHGLGGMVSLAASGATAVGGGNRQIFARFAQASGARVHLGVEVEDIKSARDTHRRWKIHTNASKATRHAEYDAVLFAAPWHLSAVHQRAAAGNSAWNLLDAAIPEQPYIHLHVTLLATTAKHPLPAFFGLPPDASVPTSILTSAVTHRQRGTPLPTFQSITYHGRVAPGADDWVVKIFSLERRSDEWLEQVFGEGTIGWVHRKEWDSYPEWVERVVKGDFGLISRPLRLPPTTSFPPIYPLGRNSTFLYLASQEPFISTMETQALAGRNAAALLAREWWGLESGVCGGKLEYGWDWTCEV